jgi:hypothetical protein
MRYDMRYVDWLLAASQHNAWHKPVAIQFKLITNQMQQFYSLLSWRLFTAQHVSGVSPPIIRSSMTAVAASGFTFVSWWQSCCVHGRAGYNLFMIYLNCTMMHGLKNLKPIAVYTEFILLMMSSKPARNM